MSTIVLGDGPLGRAIGAALEGRGDAVEVLGRPASGRHDLPALAPADLVVDASRARAVPDNVRAALGWATEHDAVRGLELAIALEEFWVLRDPPEGTSWLERLRARAEDAPPRLRATAARAGAPVKGG